MTRLHSSHRRRTERAMIDALLKISEIIKKTEKNRNASKKPIGDGDYSSSTRVPVPPPMRTLDSYVSTLNQQSAQQPSNCNRAYGDMLKGSGKRRNEEKSEREEGQSCSSIEKSIESKKKTTFTSESSHPLEQRTTVTTCQSHAASIQMNSAATTILDDQSSSLLMMPIASAPTIRSGEKSSSDFNRLIDEQLQKTLENRLRTHLTRSETEKFMNHLDRTAETNFDVEHYEKQRHLAMIAAKEGNYALSYKIYTDLLHDPQYDYQIKSEILASRATTLLLEEKCFESIDDCTQAVAYNQWNKLAYVVRAACWMIKQEYGKAVEDYSRLFHFFDQSEHVLDLLNLAYEKSKGSKDLIDDEQQSIRIEQEQGASTPMGRTSSHPSSGSFVQPAVYLCYPYQAYSAWLSTTDDSSPPTLILPNPSETSQLSNDPAMPSNNNALEHQSNWIWIKNPLTKIYS